jgi:hypothetical protein
MLHSIQWMSARNILCSSPDAQAGAAAASSLIGKQS